MPSLLSYGSSLDCHVLRHWKLKLLYLILFPPHGPLHCLRPGAGHRAKTGGQGTGTLLEEPVSGLRTKLSFHLLAPRPRLYLALLISPLGLGPGTLYSCSPEAAETAPGAPRCKESYESSTGKALSPCGAGRKLLAHPLRIPGVHRAVLPRWTLLHMPSPGPQSQEALLVGAGEGE